MSLGPAVVGSRLPGQPGVAALAVALITTTAHSLLQVRHRKLQAATLSSASHGTRAHRPARHGGALVRRNVVC